MREVVALIWGLWIDSLQVDRRQRLFLAAAGILDAGFFIALALGYSIVSIACAILGFAFSFKALKMRRAWEAAQTAASKASSAN